MIYLKILKNVERLIYRQIKDIGATSGKLTSTLVLIYIYEMRLGQVVFSPKHIIIKHELSVHEEEIATIDLNAM